MKTSLVLVSLLSLLLFQPAANAQPRGPMGPGAGPGAGMGPGGGRGMGPGWGRGPGFCKGALLQAAPAVLKAELGLDDAQLARVEALRKNFLQKQIGLRADIQRLRLEKQTLNQADLPDVDKVLQVHRKMRSVRGKLSEERIKTDIKILAALTAEQRTKVRAMCPMRGAGWGQGWDGQGQGQGWGGRGRRGPGGGW